MKEMLIRAIRTFFQAAIGYIAANLAMELSGAVEGAISFKSAIGALIAAAVSCGLAAVMNLPKKDAGSETAEVNEKQNETDVEKAFVGAFEKNDSENTAGDLGMADEIRGGDENAAAEQDSVELMEEACLTSGTDGTLDDEEGD